MNIELKKYKITTSIINQSLLGNYSLFYNNDNYDILGWCMIKGKRGYLRYIILQNKETKQLLKLPYIRSINDLTFEQKSTQLPDGVSWKFIPLYELKGYATDFSNSFTIYKQKEEESDELSESVFKKTKEFISKVNEIGQFYL